MRSHHMLGPYVLSIIALFSGQALAGLEVVAQPLIKPRLDSLVFITKPLSSPPLSSVTTTAPLPASTIYRQLATFPKSIENAPILAAQESVPSPTTSDPSMQFKCPTQFKNAVLNSTNFYRYQHNSQFVTWNDTLADYAGKWASRCEAGHSEPVWGPSPYGENVAANLGSVAGSIDAWANERSLYDFASGPNADGEATGHFTQLVWNETQTVGCGAVNCDGRNQFGGWLVICEYWPRGNVFWSSNPNDASKTDPNVLYKKNVHAQVNDGSGFDINEAIYGKPGVGTRSVDTPSNSAQLTHRAGSVLSSSAAKGVTGADSGEDRHRTQLGLVMLLTFACAFM